MEIVNQEGIEFKLYRCDLLLPICELDKGDDSSETGGQRTILNKAFPRTLTNRSIHQDDKYWDAQECHWWWFSDQIMYGQMFVLSLVKKGQRKEKPKTCPSSVGLVSFRIDLLPSLFAYYWDYNYNYDKFWHVYIWVSFCRTGKIAVLCLMFDKSRRLLWPNQ